MHGPVLERGPQPASRGPCADDSGMTVRGELVLLVRADHWSSESIGGKNGYFAAAWSVGSILASPRIVDHQSQT